MRACFGTRALRTAPCKGLLAPSYHFKTASNSMSLLRSTCSPRRVPASLTNGMTRSGRKHIHPSPHYLRQLHTATGRNTGNASSSKFFALALGSATVGLGGYYAGVRHAIESPPPKPVYGTPEDFTHAIEELKTLFSKDTVTTDEGQLDAHGFSPNAYLPGTPCHSDTNTWFADI